MPKKRQLSVALIGLLSLCVISIVVWLVLLFLSVTEGIEKNWLNKLTSINAPIRITPTDKYYNSYYYQIDSISKSSEFSLKTIGEKLKAIKSDPYDVENDEEIPSYWPEKDFIAEDPIKSAFQAFEKIQREHLLESAEDYEVSGALMRLELIRPKSRNFQSFLTQATYVTNVSESTKRLEPLILPPKSSDIENLIYLSSLSKDPNAVNAILENLENSSKSIVTLENLDLSDIKPILHFQSEPKNPPPWAYFVNGKVVLKDSQILIPKQFRDSEVLIGDRGYFSYQSVTPLSVGEQKLNLQVAGFYDPGVISIGSRFIMASKNLVRMLNTNCQLTSLDPLLSNGIQIWIRDLKKTPDVSKQIKKEFEKLGISEYFSIIPYYQYDFAKELIGQFKSDRYLFLLVGILILVVACSNIISLLLLLVNDKKHEIGVLLSLGAQKKSIAYIFGGIGIAIGFLSSLIGITLAYFTLKNITFLVNLLSSLEGQEAFNPLFYGDSLPNHLSSVALLFVLIASPLISLLAGLIPALKASKLKPSQILRSD
jgi:ABC-type lipoprotein release transport system permease subunit